MGDREMAFIPGVTLYVGDLHPDVNEGHLYLLFQKAGPVTSVRVCRDNISHRSLGYGYVNFNHSQNAVRALAELNYSQINGKTIRVMWSIRDPSIRRSGLGNVFIKNLHESIDNRTLHDKFSIFGRILSCKVAMQDRKSKGYGFVNFESEEDANMAIEKANGMLINEKKVYVGKFIRKTERTSSGGELQFTNVFIKNLDPDITEEALTETFSKFGKISTTVIMKQENGESKGFGFVNFECTYDAKKAVEEMNGALLGSKQIFAGRAQKKAEREQILKHQFEEKRIEKFQRYKECNLYIKNLEDGVDDDYLRKHFGIYGTIVSAKVMRDERGFSRGFGFLCFSTPEDAKKAMVEEQGCLILHKRAFITMAQRKEIRRVDLEKNFAQMVMKKMSLPGLMYTYPSTYYPPHGAVPPLQQRPGAYQQISWRNPTEFQPSPGAVITGFQPRPVMHTGHQPMQQQLNPHVMNSGQVYPQFGQNGYAPHQQPPVQQMILKDPKWNLQQHQQSCKFVPNGCAQETSVAPPSGSQTFISGNGGTDNNPEQWHSLLVNASAGQQKEMIRERLHPLVQQQKDDMAEKITEILLEQDISEVLLLLESPDTLISKMDEVFKMFRRHLISSQEEEPANRDLVQVNGQ